VMKLNFMALVLISIFSVGLGPLWSQSSDLFNPMCPVYTDEPSDREINVNHEGKSVYFCCKKCVRKFKENPDEFAKNIKYNHQENNIHEKGDHDHSNHHGKGSLSLLGKFHPAIVHFPIAGVFFAFFLQMLAHLKKDEHFYESIKFILMLTTAFTFLAGVSGWINASGQNMNSLDLKAIDLHRWFGMSAGVFILMCTILQRKDYPKNSFLYGIYMGFMIISLILVSITGHLGGLLVFGEQYFQL